jgi:hypothetical protein
MDLKWTAIEEPEAPAFRNDSSPYAHFWLTATAGSPKDGSRQDQRRSVVDLTTRLEATVDELIGRAFEK